MRLYEYICTPAFVLCVCVCVYIFVLCVYACIFVLCVYVCIFVLCMHVYNLYMMYVHACVYTCSHGYTSVYV